MYTVWERKERIEARRWNGEESARWIDGWGTNQIIEWIEWLGYSARYVAATDSVPEHIAYDTSLGEARIFVGDFLVRGLFGLYCERTEHFLNMWKAVR